MYVQRVLSKKSLPKSANLDAYALVCSVSREITAGGVLMRAMRLSLCGAVLVLLANLPLLAQTQAMQLTTVTPCRLVDTRQSGGPITGGNFRTFNLPQLAQTAGCQNLSSATAYSLNVTVVPHGYLGYLTIWPAGQNRPVISLMNSFDGRIKANAAIVLAGNSGAVNVYVTNTANVVIDIDAYFQPSTSVALAYYPLTPCRVADTRNGGDPLQGGVEQDFDVLASGCQVPQNALAYSLNFTVVPNPPGQILGYLTVWPAGQQRPTVSTLNNLTGTIVANAAIVPATGSNGEVAVYPSNSTDLVIDISGYFAPATPQSGYALYPLTPCRALDTRPHPFSGQQAENILGSSCGPPNIALGYVLNATALPHGALGYLTLWPDGLQQPLFSNLNGLDGAITSNMAIVGTSNGSIDAFAAGNTDLLLDLAGYMAPLETLTVSTSLLPGGTTGQPYQAQLGASGGEGPYTWTITSGSLPPGLTMTSAGLITGVPTHGDTYPFTVQVIDHFGSIASKALSLGVANGSLVILTSHLAVASVGVPYNAALQAVGGAPPYTWSTTAGALPSGLSLDPATGIISGTPTIAGGSNFTAQVQDTQTSTSKDLEIAVAVQNNSTNLNGHYAFSLNAFNGGNPVYIAGSFVANGVGVLIGTLDINTGQGSLPAGHSFTGTFTTDLTSLATMQFTVPDLGMTLNFDFAVFYNGNGQLIETDLNQPGAGFFVQQNATAFQVPPAGNYAMGSFGSNADFNRYAKAGAFTVGASGAVTAGVEDVNDNGNLAHRTFSGTFAIPDTGTGRGQATLMFPDGSTNNYQYYVISAGQFILIGTDPLGPFDPLTLGSIQVQSAGSFNTGSLNGGSILELSGLSPNGGNPQADAVLGLFNWNGSGIGTATLDENNGGVMSLSTLQGNYIVEPNGRVTLTGFGNNAPIFYLSSPSQAFVVGQDNAVSAGVLEPQAPLPLFDNSAMIGTLSRRHCHARASFNRQ